MKLTVFLKLPRCFAGVSMLVLLPISVARAAETSAPPVAAAVEHTIEAIVTEALEKNPELKFYEAEIAAAQAGRRSAGSLGNPELSVGIGQKTVRGGGLSEEGVAWSAALMQPFEWPGRVGLRKAIANRNLELAQLGLAQFRSALAGRVRSLAHALAVAQQHAAATRVVAGRLNELRDTMVARDPAGLTPLLETRVIEASSVKAEHTAAEAEHDVEHLSIELNYWRGQSPNVPVRVAPASPRFPPPPGLEEAWTAAATNNFELRLRIAELEQQGFKVALARNERFPSIAVGPAISEERAGSRERIIGLAVSLPLPLWQDNRAKVDTAEARRMQAEAALESARRRLERDVADYRHKYEHALGVLAKWRPDAIPHFQEAAELADRHYRLGAVPLPTYVELQRQYVEAVEALLDARKEAVEAAGQLELLTGLPLLPAGVVAKGDTK
jgi:cobalt-zinc-cadmium efflux system outer membrane protein